MSARMVPQRTKLVVTAKLRYMRTHVVPLRTARCELVVTMKLRCMSTHNVPQRTAECESHWSSDAKQECELAVTVQLR